MTSAQIAKARLIQVLCDDHARGIGRGLTTARDLATFALRYLNAGFFPKAGNK